MLAIISPAKTLDFENAVPKKLPHFQPNFLAQSQQLIDICRELTPADIGSLMLISDKLAGLNAARFAEWQQNHNEHNAKAAVYAFKGDVYTGLDIESLNEEDVLFAQQHLRILSGLYGLLTPLDLIQPYRLEWGQNSLTRKARIYMRSGIMSLRLYCNKRSISKTVHSLTWHLMNITNRCKNTSSKLTSLNRYF